MTEKSFKKRKAPSSLFPLPSLLFSLFYCLFIIYFFFSAPIADAAGAKEVISGYYKALTAFTKAAASKEGIYYALQRLRLEFKPKLAENVEANFTYDHELLSNDFSNTADFRPIRQKNQKNLAWWDADKVISDTDHIYEKHLLHRAYIKFESPYSRVTFGKQLIDWGRMRLYSPLDIFNQPLPSDIEADERPGFDALNIELFGEAFSSINIVIGPGRTEGRASYGARLYKKIGTYDMFIIAAKHEKEKVAGVGFDGYIKGAGFRGEATYTKDGKERYPRFSVGADYSISSKTTLLFEYFYNGAANRDLSSFTDSIIEQRKRLSVEKNLLSCVVTHDVTPLLKFKLLTIYDTRGKSAFLNPEIRYNVKESFDISCGIQAFAESKGSEFEGSNNLYYAELKYFF